MKLKDPFGNFYLLKAFLVFTVGWLSWYGFAIVNSLNFRGLSNVKRLPKKKVLFVSNHQTYYADVVAINHGLHRARHKGDGRMIIPFYLFWPKVKSYYVAAEETMKSSGIIPKIFSYAGAITVKRTWREKGQTIQRKVDVGDQDKIRKALMDGWIITFPQGTTKAFSPLRKGTAHIIRNFNPVVVPVKVDGFRRGFEKKGLFFKKKGIKLMVEFKEPLEFDENDSDEDILTRIAQELDQDYVPNSILLEDNDKQKS